jgi:hypothetical protein
MKFTAQRIKQDLGTNHPEVMQHFEVAAKDRDYQFWKRNSLCVDLNSNNIIEEKLNYIHKNPVKAELAFQDIDYRFSSAKFYYELGDEFGFLKDYRA